MAGHAQRAITVHLENTMTVPVPVMERAKAVTTAILGEAEVKVEWKLGAPSRKTEGETLEVQLDPEAAERFPRDAMAYAVPGSHGVCIHVFYDRVLLAYSHELTPILLGHVLAHEIGHVLEGVARHSQTGLMKARWTIDDYDGMFRKPLLMAPEDVALVRAAHDPR